jgi:hypothetical protein
MWWDKVNASSPGLASGQNIQRASDVEDSYLDSAFIAQCPNCGSFALDATVGTPEWDISCLDCDWQFFWLPGTPWPPVQVRPRLRRDADHPGPFRGGDR